MLPEQIVELNKHAAFINNGTVQGRAYAKQIKDRGFTIHSAHTKFSTADSAEADYARETARLYCDTHDEFIVEVPGLEDECANSPMADSIRWTGVGAVMMYYTFPLVEYPVQPGVKFTLFVGLEKDEDKFTKSGKHMATLLPKHWTIEHMPSMTEEEAEAIING